MSESDRREMSISQAAQVLGVSESTVRRMFDADPTAGSRLEAGTGRTGTGERRVAVTWVERLQRERAEHSQ